MRIRLYQTTSADFRFMGSEYFHKKGRSIHVRYYQPVYSGEVPDGSSLNDIYAIFNRDDRPHGDKMCSLSVSDVIVLVDQGNKAMFVDNWGFTHIPVFFSGIVVGAPHTEENVKIAGIISSSEGKKELRFSLSFKIPAEGDVISCIERELDAAIHPSVRDEVRWHFS